MILLDDDFNKKFYYDLKQTDDSADLFEFNKINYVTPMRLFMKTFCNCDLTHYITHNEVTTNERKHLFILRESVVLTKYIEDFSKVDYNSKDLVETKLDYVKISYLNYEVHDDTRNIVLRILNHDSLSFDDLYTY